MKDLIKWFLLWILSVMLMVLLGILGTLYAVIKLTIKRKRRELTYYFHINAVSGDQHGSIILCHLLDDTCLKGDYMSFKQEDYTISAILGENEHRKTLTGFGKLLCLILNTIDPNHTQKALLNKRNNFKIKK